MGRSSRRSNKTKQAGRRKRADACNRGGALEVRRQKLIGKSLKLHGRAGMKTAARWVNKRAKINVGDLDEAAHKSDDESAGLAQGTRALLLLALVALRLRRCERVDVASCVEDLSV